MQQSILSIASLYYYRNLLSPYGVRGLEYLTKERGLFLHTIEKHTLGTSISLFGLQKELESHGVSVSDMIASNMVRMEDSNMKLKDFFYKFITIPIIKNGVPTSMTGRAIPNGVSTIRHKHLNGSLTFLYNGDIIPTTKTVIVTEAPMDCLTLTQQGFPAVSCYGTNSFRRVFASRFTNDNEIYIMFDNDKDEKKGFLGALNTAWIIFNHKKLIPKIAILPQQCDINELWLYSKKDFKDKINQSLKEARPYTYYYDHLTTQRKKQYRKEASVGGFKIPKEVKDLPITAVISKFIELEPAGIGSYRALCPFHNDKKTKSFFVYENTNIFYCYGCPQEERWGDSVEFVRKIKRLSLNQAVKWIENNVL